MLYIYHRLIAEMPSIMFWCKVYVRACPRRLRCPGCRKRRSIARGNRLAILSACQTTLSLLWRRVFDRAVTPVLLVNSALDVQSGKWTREHSGEYVCMLRQICPGVSKSTEDIWVRAVVWTTSGRHGQILLASFALELKVYAEFGRGCPCLG